MPKARNLVLRKGNSLENTERQVEPLRASSDNWMVFEFDRVWWFAVRNTVNCRQPRYLSGTFLEGV